MPVSEKEEKLAKKLKLLNKDELKAYNYFVDNEVIGLSEETSDKMLDLYCNGSSCDDIRKLIRGYSLGQIVAARISWDWDERKEERIKKIVENMPSQTPLALLESQEFLSDMLRATQRRFKQNLKKYIATGDEEALDGFKLPNNIKEYSQLVEIFMKASGFDSEKSVKHTHTIEPPKEPEKIEAPMSDEETLDDLLNRKKSKIKDVEFQTVEPKQIEAPVQNGSNNS